MPEFDKWWDDLKKHEKRVRHWLPHWQQLAARLNHARQLRYFTLCARSMIDVFMLVRAGIVRVDTENSAISNVQFCECDQEQFAEITDMFAREDAGVFGELQDIVLFEDDDFTAQCPTLDSIEHLLEDEHLHADIEKVDRLLLKRAFLNFRLSFPYDCVNLDFCGYYYHHPPGMLCINRTIERFLEWQRSGDRAGQGRGITEFILTVTCRYDRDFPPEAELRLKELIRCNVTSSATYRDEVARTRGAVAIDAWPGMDGEDFFLAAWPKDIAAAGRDRGWSMRVLDYVFYRRLSDSGIPYVIACLVAQFEATAPRIREEAVALHVLRQENRTFIDDIDRRSAQGSELIRDLNGIVAIRNEQAGRRRCRKLPAVAQQP